MIPTTIASEIAQQMKYLGIHCQLALIWMCFDLSGLDLVLVGQAIMLMHWRLTNSTLGSLTMMMTMMNKMDLV